MAKFVIPKGTKVNKTMLKYLEDGYSVIRKFSYWCTGDEVQHPGEYLYNVDNSREPQAIGHCRFCAIGAINNNPFTGKSREGKGRVIAHRTIHLLDDAACAIYGEKDTSQFGSYGPTCLTAVEVNDEEYSRENHKRVKKLYRVAIKAAKEQLGVE